MEFDNPCPPRADDAACAEMPELRRVHYFHGQLLGVQDFRTEQAYFRAKHQLHNRCLHGRGTVCGLRVVPLAPPQLCESPTDEQRRKLEAELDRLEAEIAKARDVGNPQLLRTLQQRQEEPRRELESLPPVGCEEPAVPKVVLECGLAIDGQGDEIVVPRPHTIDPWHWLSAADRKRVQDATEGLDLYLSICHCEQPVDPTRPLLPDACGAAPECLHGKVRETYRLRITVEAPPDELCCDPCCTDCGGACILLAVLLKFRKGVGAAAIDNSVRRVLETATSAAATITGISWTHGATYSSQDAGEILGGPEGGAGLRVDFSRPVLVSTLTRGVVDVWVIAGGRTNRAGVYYLEGEFGDFGSSETTRSLRIRYTGDENLDPGDRVLVTIRCAFILDECCRPVDGTHAGGRVPLIDDPEFAKFARTVAAPRCAVKPPGYGPWTTGAGAPGATFESWFYIEPAAFPAKRRGQESRK